MAQRRALHMEPRPGPSQTCFVSLLGFVSCSTYFPIRNQLQLVTLWKEPPETQCYHDPRRPGSAVRMFVRPFVWAECAHHIHVNLLPGCFQISRANPKRPQLLKRGFVLETHWRLFGSCVRQKVRGARCGQASVTWWV